MTSPGAARAADAARGSLSGRAPNGAPPRFGWRQGAPAAAVSLQAVAAAVVLACRAARDARVARADPARATWRGWSSEALRALPTYARYAVPAAAMLCAEWWIWSAAAGARGGPGRRGSPPCP